MGNDRWTTQKKRLFRFLYGHFSELCHGLKTTFLSGNGTLKAVISLITSILIILGHGSKYLHTSMLILLVTEQWPLFIWGGL